MNIEAENWLEKSTYWYSVIMGETAVDQSLNLQVPPSLVFYRLDEVSYTKIHSVSSSTSMFQEKRLGSQYTV